MYDIVGDVHGHADELEQLLQKMGYRKKDGVYSHPSNRKAVFVGDYIDRGLKVRETLYIIKNMCDAGEAKAVMGNHEFNALCYHTPDGKGGYLREHSDKNRKQHKETLEAFKNYEDEWNEFLEWFKDLPLYLDLDPFRVVHACWDEEHIDWLDEHYSSATPEFLHAASDKTQKAYSVIEETLKGKEHTLPDGISFFDKDGHERFDCRVKWWTNSEYRKTYDDVLMECPDAISHDEINSSDTFYSHTGDKPVFFGHYWLKGLPELNHSKAVCLDYISCISVGRKWVGGWGVCVVK
ncbi:MAG TPA: metallophosphoesterase [Balneolaceae bacterium]